MHLRQDPHHSLKLVLQTFLAEDDPQIDVFCGKFKVINTRKNQLLLSAGEVCKQMYFVDSGCLRIYLLDKKGSESTRFLICEGAFGTSFPSFIRQEPSVSAIQCLEACSLLCISHADFQKLLKDFPVWDRIYRINLENEYISAITRIETLITLNSRQRYEDLLARHPSYIRRFPSRIIADYLGITYETLSRLKSAK